MVAPIACPYDRLARPQKLPDPAVERGVPSQRQPRLDVAVIRVVGILSSCRTDGNKGQFRSVKLSLLGGSLHMAQVITNQHWLPSCRVDHHRLTALGLVRRRLVAPAETIGKRQR